MVGAVPTRVVCWASPIRGAVASNCTIANVLAATKASSARVLRLSAKFILGSCRYRFADDATVRKSAVAGHGLATGCIFDGSGDQMARLRGVRQQRGGGRETAAHGRFQRGRI